MIYLLSWGLNVRIWYIFNLFVLVFWVFIVDFVSILFKCFVEILSFCRGLELLKWEELFYMYVVVLDMLKFIVYFES